MACRRAPPGPAPCQLPGGPPAPCPPRPAATARSVPPGPVMESSGTQSCPATCVAFSRTRKGLVLIGEIVLCLLTLVCFGASRTGYVGLAVVELVLAALVLLAWSCRLPQRMQLLHWGWSDFTRCVIGGVLFLIISLIVIISHRDGAGIAGGVFGLLAGILLGYDAYITFPLRQGHTAAPTESPEGA